MTNVTAWMRGLIPNLRGENRKVRLRVDVEFSEERMTVAAHLPVEDEVDGREESLYAAFKLI